MIQRHGLSSQLCGTENNVPTLIGACREGEREHGLDLWSSTPEYAHRTGIYSISNQQ